MNDVHSLKDLSTYLRHDTGMGVSSQEFRRTLRAQVKLHPINMKRKVCFVVEFLGSE